ncbi:diguanylate cyclase [Arthrobacter sp. NEB 688]|uniref:diguanylate cyclase domain-containing protein n=1 Tax=Arthrobacter sp. NEB 688 TaxID=904039 RepID=UPI001564E1AC|nr:diguanylate cyclase [Arthrobacter sp. NEB 688]QKE82539.1 diguanylate cyclase [Arthrobacter sp. NEB 688]
MLRRTVGFLALYCLALAVGRATAQPETHLALFWPAAGVGVLWALRTVTRRELALAVTLTGIAASIGNIVTGFAIGPGLVLGLGNLLLGLVTTVVYRVAAPRHERRGSMRRLSELNRLVLAAGVATLATSACGFVALTLDEGSAAWTVGLAMYLRNLASVVVVVGATLGTRQNLQRPTARQAAEAVAIFALTSAVAWWVFGPGQSLPLAFLPLGLLMWAGVRLPLPLTALDGAVVAVIPLVRLMTGAGGPFDAIAAGHLQSLVLQVYMMFAAFLALVLGTFRAELRSLVGSVRREHRWSDLLIAYAPSGLLVVRPTGHVLQANQAVGEILRRDPADLVGTRGDSLDDDPASGLGAVLAAAVAADGELIHAEWTARGPVDALLTLSCSARAVPGPDGEVVVLVNVVDVSERRRIEQRHAHDAAHDQLTGLPNRRQLDTLISCHAQTARMRSRGALLLIDLDHFKQVNDTRGHAAGDTLLADVARVMARVVGTSGTVGRRGGDEFEVLLPEADQSAAEAVAWALVDAVDKHGRTTQLELGCAVSASIGVATFAQAHAAGRDVQALADAAMYSAKRTGGNKARTWQGVTETAARRVTPLPTSA